VLNTSITAATRTFTRGVTRGHILYMCKRPIRKGEELTIDYHFAKNVEKVPCKCGSPNCRGTINIR